MRLHQCHQQMQQQNEHPPSHRPPQERLHADDRKYFTHENNTRLDYEVYRKLSSVCKNSPGLDPCQLFSYRTYQNRTPQLQIRQSTH